MRTKGGGGAQSEEFFLGGHSFFYIHFVYKVLEKRSEQLEPFFFKPI